MSDNPIQAPSPEHLAELLPQYGIDEFIAQGGMGAVYKARQLSLDRDVAIKVLLHEFGEDAEFRESFTTEAKAMARLNHPNLLGVFDYGDVDGMPYIVIEYVDGGSLHQAAFNQAIDPAQAVAIVKGICDGLAHAHEHDIVHRDIKPSNILLTQNIEPKIADFGLAHAADSDKPGLVMGTPGYTAPEVFHDPNQAGKLADIYSVGVILHQLLTGIDPAGKFEPPNHPTGNIRLDAIWRKATHINPAQRYPSVAAMAADLEKWAAAQQKSPAARGVAPGRPVKRPLPSGSSGGGLSKVFIMVILLAGAAIAFLLLQEKKNDIEIPPDTADLPVPPPEPNPAPLPEPPAEPEPAPMPDPAETVRNEEPELPPAVENKPEPEPEPEPDAELSPGDPGLRTKAIGLILDARKKRDKELADNARPVLSQLDSAARGASPDEARTLERLKADIVENHIPLTDGVTGISDALSRSFTQALAKEQSISQSHRSDLTRIRDAYVTRLESAAAQAADEDLKRRLLAQAGQAKDLDAWIAQLSPETPWIPKQSSGGGMVGKWINRSYNQESEWVAHPDGRMEIVGEKWEVTWEILPDGTLKVDWNEQKQYFYKRDGDGWTGKNPHGGVATLRPGGS